ncbi:MAG: outer membrane lipoprotein-sorting protein [Desulfobacula sp.]|nr:outer membrane lipoprotein-sorting protein [Desulfobacula sp.]
MKIFKSFGYVIIVLLISCFYANANDMTGKELAQKVFDRDRGNNSISTAQMVLVNKSGNKRTRQFVNQRILENDLESQIIRFTSPADIDGTGFLTIEKPGLETEQFLYLPALRRTRRIVSSQKSHRFVNSDFTYEDMERHPVDDYTYKIIGSKSVGTLECYELEIRPKKTTESQYSLTQSLVTKQSLVPLLVKYFDKKGNHIKTYKVLKLEQVQGIWTESTISMEDSGKGHKPIFNLKTSNIIQILTKI